MYHKLRVLNYSMRLQLFLSHLPMILVEFYTDLIHVKKLNHLRCFN